MYGLNRSEDDAEGLFQELAELEKQWEKCGCDKLETRIFELENLIMDFRLKKNKK